MPAKAAAPLPEDASSVDPGDVSANGAEAPHRSSTPLFLAALLARTWLWFVAGCLLVTLLPSLLGWRPYVVETGSMGPRIDAGDIVLASPEDDATVLLGRVTVFTDPENRDRTKTHRVVALNDDGTLVTKGDANPDADTAAVRMSDVKGLGRLLVSFAGLPLLWLHTGQWMWLALFVLSLLVSAYLVGRDRDDEEPDDGTDGPDGPDGELLPLPVRLSEEGTLGVAASRPPDPGTSRSGLLSRLGRRAGYVLVLASALMVPSTSAAFAATSQSAANAWSVPNWDYTATIQGDSPYLYWKLDETTTTTTAADSSGNGRDGRYYSRGSASYFTRNVVGALTSESPNLAVTLRNSNSCITTRSGGGTTAPQQVTVIAWFSTTSDQGGKIVGFEMPQTGVAPAGNGGTYDRHLYLDGAGRVWWGVYNGGYHVISTPSGTAYNDGEWHMAAGVLGPQGEALYVDGLLVGTDPNTQGEGTTGWWRAGCGNLAGWGSYWTGPNNPTTNSGTPQNQVFLGSLDEISVHYQALSATQIYQAYLAH